MSEPWKVDPDLCGTTMKITTSNQRTKGDGAIWVEVAADGTPVIVGMYNCTIEPSKSMDEIRKLT